MRYNIILVDDVEDLVVNLKAELEYANPDWNVNYFTSGYEALKNIFKGNIDVVVSDIAMPDMDGYELYSRIKDYDVSIPVIFMTGFGYDPGHVVVRTKQQGPIDILSKPFPTDKLVTLITKRLEERKSSKAE
jgi:DNA-binding NtrC family response regulator